MPKSYGVICRPNPVALECLPIISSDRDILRGKFFDPFLLTGCQHSHNFAWRTQDQ